VRILGLMKISTLLLIIAIGCGLGGTTSVVADQDTQSHDHHSEKARQHDIVREALRRGEILSLQRIMAIVEKHVPGDILEIELEGPKKGRPMIYEIKVLTETGRVREIKLDARTGMVLSSEDD